MKFLTKKLFLFSAFLPVLSAQGMFSVNLSKPVSCLKMTFSGAKSANFAKKLHIDHIKNTYKGLLDSAKHLSPAHAASLVETGFLQELYQRGDKEHATIKLLTDEKLGLFHLLGQEEFRTTQNKSNPCYSLTPELIGMIIGTIENKTFSNPATKKQIIQEWRAQHKKITSDTPSLTKMQTVLERIEQAVHECDQNNANAHYLPFTLHTTLLGYLYKKSKHSDDLWHYLTTAHKYHPTLKEDILVELQNQEHKGSLTIYNKNDEQQFYTTHFAQQKDADINSSGDHYENTVHWIIKKNCYDTPFFPPKVAQGYYGFNNQREAADCMEASMRTLFNELYANHETNSFDVTMLPKTIKPHESLTAFYTTFNDYSSVNTDSAGQAWLNLCAEHKNVEYSQRNYIVRAKSSNIVHLFNNLFKVQATTLEELGTLLSDKNRTITFTLRKNEHLFSGGKNNDWIEELIVTINNIKAQKSRIITITFTPAHAEAKIINGSEQTHKNLAHLCNNTFNVLAKTNNNHGFVPQLAQLSILIGTMCKKGGSLFLTCLSNAYQKTTAH